VARIWGEMKACREQIDCRIEPARSALFRAIYPIGCTGLVGYKRTAEMNRHGGARAGRRSVLALPLPLPRERLQELSQRCRRPAIHYDGNQGSLDSFCSREQRFLPFLAPLRRGFLHAGPGPARQFACSASAMALVSCGSLGGL